MSTIRQEMAEFRICFSGVIFHPIPLNKSSWMQRNGQTCFGKK